MRNVVWQAVFVSGACLLSGCQLLGVHHVSRASDQLHPVAGAPALAGSYLQAGRENLRLNRNGLAIEAFNLAMANGEDPAAAYNGLGVAYARIGRTDLAYRFFKKASMSDPTNPSYARNLALLMDSPSFALKLMVQSARPATQPTTQQSKLISAGETKANGVRLVRDNGRQFNLVTVDPSASKSPDVRNAASELCATSKRQATCKMTRLPTMVSRNRAPRTNRQASDPLAQPASGPPRTIRNDPSAPVGADKRKTVDLTAAQPKPSTSEEKSAAATLSDRKI